MNTASKNMDDSGNNCALPEESCNEESLGMFMDVPISEIIKSYNSSLSEFKKSGKDIIAWVRDDLLWSDPRFLGYTTNGKVVIQFQKTINQEPDNLDDFLFIPLTQYLDYRRNNPIPNF